MFRLLTLLLLVQIAFPVLKFNIHWGGIGAPTVFAISTGLINPAISFSPDQSKITITYLGRTHVFNRPLILPTTFAPSGSGRVYWVDVNGHDSGSGTSGSPYQTIGKAISVAGPGDVVEIRAGTYQETLEMTRSGTASAPIIVTAAPDALGLVKIRRSDQQIIADPTAAVISLTGVHYIWISGLVIEGTRGRAGAPLNDDYSANGVTWRNGAGIGTRLLNSVIYDALHSGLKEMDHGGSGIDIEANVIFGNGTDELDHGIYMPASNTQIIGNIIFDNTGYGIHAYSQPQHLLIAHNLVVENAKAGILLAASYSQVYQNTVAYNWGGILYYRGTSYSNVVKNNIAAYNSYFNDGFDDYGETPHDNTDDYNLYFGSSIQSEFVGDPDPKINAGSHTVTKNPRFVDPTLGDYRLLPTSPAIDVGADVGEPYLGSAPNLGAY